MLIIDNVDAETTTKMSRFVARQTEEYIYGSPVNLTEMTTLTYIEQQQQQQ